MAISTIGSDGLATSAVTSTKLSSGVPTRAQLPAGTVLQVVSVTKTDGFSTSSTTPVDITGLSASITPTSATSKILIIANVFWSTSMYTNGGFYNSYFTVCDGSNNVLCKGDANGGRQRVSMGGSNFYMAAQGLQQTISYLWSPGSASAQTVKMRCWSSNAGDVEVNYSYNENNVGTPGGNYTGTSTITLMEIAV